jgi:hypothetical protein
MQLPVCISRAKIGAGFADLKLRIVLTDSAGLPSVFIYYRIHGVLFFLQVVTNVSGLADYQFF